MIQTATTASNASLGKGCNLGLKRCLSKLQEQRNAARKDMDELRKQYEFYKDYANPEGQQYVKTLFDFNERFKRGKQPSPVVGAIVARNRVRRGRPRLGAVTGICGDASRCPNTTCRGREPCTGAS